MVQEATFLPDLRFAPPKFFEYLLVVHPNEEIFNQLKVEKENFSSGIQCKHCEKNIATHNRR